MKKTIAFTMSLLVSISVFGASVKNQSSRKSSAKISKAGKSAKSAKSATASEYQTTMAFDGATLNGKLAEGSLRKIVVENDKSLDDLLGVRKKFDDREHEESQRNAQW
jgi:hypothetical protein